MMAVWSPDDPPRRRRWIDPETLAVGQGFGLGLIIGLALWTLLGWAAWRVVPWLLG